MKPVIVHDSAKAEIRNALEKYDQIRADLAADFRRILDSAIERIQSNPRFYAEEPSGERYCMLGRFPYTLVYLELDESI